MKKVFILTLACFCFAFSYAQRGYYRGEDNNKNNDYGELKGGFKQQNIFIGGGASLGGGYGQFSFGLSPEIGYSFTRWLDAGLGLNVIYTSMAANTFYNPTSTRLRQWNYGGGPFFRVYPVNFLFLQGQFEQNWTKVTIKDGNVTYRQTVDASSLIAGIGYTQRQVGQGSYYIMVGLDLLKNPYSPYVSENSVGQLVANPIVRVGFNFYLKPAKSSMRDTRLPSDRTL